MNKMVADKQVSGSVRIVVENLKDGNDLTSTMKSGLFRIDVLSYPFVLQKVAWGNLMSNNDEKKLIDVTLMFPATFHETLFTKNGYVSVLITSKTIGQFYVYMKKKVFEKFVAAFCMHGI